jgi:hypothetical protein
MHDFCGVRKAPQQEKASNQAEKHTSPISNIHRDSVVNSSAMLLVSVLAL